jgi:hypothetical protein
MVIQPSQAGGPLPELTYLRCTDLTARPRPSERRESQGGCQTGEDPPIHRVGAGGVRVEKVV